MDFKKNVFNSSVCIRAFIFALWRKTVKWTNHCWAGTSTTTEVEDWKCFMKMLYFEFITYTCKICWRRWNLPSTGFPARKSVCKYLHSFFRLNCLFAYAFLYFDYFKFVLFSWFEDVVFIVKRIFFFSKLEDRQTLFSFTFSEAMYSRKRKLEKEKFFIQSDRCWITFAPH